MRRVGRITTELARGFDAWPTSSTRCRTMLGVNRVRNLPPRGAVLSFVGIFAVGFLAMHGSGGVFERSHESPATMAMADSGAPDAPTASDVHGDESNPSHGTHLALGLCMAVAVAAVALIGRALLGAVGSAVAGAAGSETRHERAARWLLRPPLLVHRVVVLRC